MINGDRIRQAREIKALTQGELAERCGTSQSHVALFEQNLRTPSDETLELIAVATGFPIPFFKRESAPDLPLGSLLYRKRKTMSSRDRDQVRQLARLVFELIEDLASRFKRIELRLPRMAGATPEDAARITRAELGMSPESPATNLSRRLERNGIVVLPIHLEIDEHDAFSVWADTEPRTPVIVTTAGRPGDRQRWSMAHELGHLVLHQAFTLTPSAIEDEADVFAGEFLLPEDAMRKDLSAPLTLTALADLKSRWGVSMQALVMRAFNLDIVTDGQRRYLFRQFVAKGWMRDEPVLIPSEKPRLLRKLAESAYGQSVDARTISARIDAPWHLIGPALDACATSTDLRAATLATEGPIRRATGNLLSFRKN
jgi:Zn-dependent peptidase ImmA (M78 family)/DNA-binding XRE family transcriptional regulator